MLKGELDMRIAICDDEKDALQQTINIVNNVFYEMNIQCYIDQFTNALDLVQFRFYIEILLHQRGFHNFCHDSNLLNAFTN